MKDIHVIPFEQLVHTKWEHLIPKEHLEAAKARYNGTALPPKEEHHHDDETKPAEMSELDKKIEEKIAGIMKLYGVKRESIVVNKEKMPLFIHTEITITLIQLMNINQLELDTLIAIMNFSNQKKELLKKKEIKFIQGKN